MNYLLPNRARLQLLRAAGFDVGAAYVKSGSIVRCRSLTIGDGCFVNHRCLFEQGEVTLGSNVYVSSGVTFATGDHRPGPAGKRAGENYDAPIFVEDGCWLGANVIVLRGVRIASGCVVGAGAVVTRDTDANGVYAGVPARRIKDLG